MPKDCIRWGILGTSPISETMANAIHESSIGHLEAVGSRSLLRAEAFSKKFAIPKVYDDYERLLGDPEIDVVYLGLPNHLHKDWIIKTAQAKKHILCEKPFVLNKHEALEAISAVMCAKVFCMEGLMYRCHPFISKLKELIDSQILGEIRLFNALYTADIVDKANQTAGGSIFNLGCYPVSLVRLLAKAKPTTIFGIGRLNRNNGSDSQACAIITFDDGAMAVISTADDMAMAWQFEVHGTKGKMSVLSNPWLPNFNSKVLLTRYDEEKTVEIEVNAKKSVYAYLIDSVNNNVVVGSPPYFGEISLQDSLDNVVILRDWFEQVVGRKR